jgi:hypothetical protein
MSRPMAMKYRKTPAWLVPTRRWVIELIPKRLLRAALFASVMRARGNFANPQTFNEKVNWRILNDRRDRIVKACDKLSMKEMARAAYPGPDLRIAETLWSGTDLRDAPDLATLSPWVLKPNHSSGHALFGPDPRADLSALQRGTASWLRETPIELGEWGYSQARPLLLIEERIQTPDGKPPADYKFFVFDGRIELIQVNRGRFGKNLTATFMDAEWRQFSVRQGERLVIDEPRPPELDKMSDIARALGAGWDFIRIDLYAVGGEVWFGEFTPYPGSGLLPYKPMSFDLEQGMLWKLPTLDEVRSGRP